MAKEKIKTTEDLEALLTGFTGTENWYKHWLGFKYTDGVKYMADVSGSYWLLDVVGSYQPQLSRAEFQIWRMQSKDGKGKVDVREDSDLASLVSQDIEFTDFPEGTFEMYFTDRTLLLKGEY